jgi:hypothetical protein
MTSDISTAQKSADRSDRRTGPVVPELAAHKPQHRGSIVSRLVLAFDGSLTANDALRLSALPARSTGRSLLDRAGVRR